MGNRQTVLENHGYTLEKELGNDLLVKTQQGDYYKIKVREVNDKLPDLQSLPSLQHPHINRIKETFQDEDILYVVMDYCGGGNLSQKIKEYIEENKQFSEEQILGWIIKICMALKYLHDNNILHRNLQPQSILFTDCGTICLGEFGELSEKSNEGQITNDTSLTYIAPEILNGNPYDKKSEIWSLGCVLYELCMQKSAFSAQSTMTLIPKILTGVYEEVPDIFSQNLRQLITDCLQTDPNMRPSAKDILDKPFVISSLSNQTKVTTKELDKCIERLRGLADGLESVHFGTTVGSLTGGVIGAAGGITSIVGLVLAPFTVGASLIMTGVGVGVAVAGGATAGISNITNMVNQSSDRQTIKNIIREFQEKLESVVTSIKHITEILEELNQQINLDNQQSPTNAERLVSAGLRVGRGLAGIPELVRLVQVANMGKVASQTARALKLAKVATGIFSGFFVALDLFFIASDVKELNDIRQAKATESSQSQNSRLVHQDTETSDTESISKLKTAFSDSNAEKPSTSEVTSETMKFVLKIKETANEMQLCVDELKDIINVIPDIPDLATEANKTT